MIIVAIIIAVLLLFPVPDTHEGWWIGAVSSDFV